MRDVVRRGMTKPRRAVEDEVSNWLHCHFRFSNGAPEVLEFDLDSVPRRTAEVVSSPQIPSYCTKAERLLSFVAGILKLD